MATKKPKKTASECEHDLAKEYYGGYDTGDYECRKCKEIFTRAEVKGGQDVNQNAKRIFDEMIERSEQPPHRGKLKVAPTPAKKTGATE